VRALYLAFAYVVLAFMGCDDDAPPPPGGDAGAGAFAASACGQCVLDACHDAIASCRSDAACTRHLACLLRCPVGADGNADAACEAACPEAATSEARRLIAGLAACRRFGAGATCEACNVPPEPESPLFHQECEPRPEPAPTPCRQCHWDRCCDTWDACYAEGADPECDALVTCIAGCSSPLAPCVALCMQRYPGGKNGAFRQIACAAAVCAIEQVDCDRSQRDACDVCQYEACGDPYVELLSDPEGALLYFCAADCAGSEPEREPCLRDCVERHPAAEGLWSAWTSCALGCANGSC
jgi:hypothetical protein